MNQNNQADFFLPPALVEEVLTDLLKLASTGLSSLEAIPVRQRTDDERLMLGKARNEVKAYRTALDYWRAGIYPSCLDGIWSIESLSERGQVIHHIWREFDTQARVYRWRCDCKCAERSPFHVHQAVMTAIEVALDRADSLAYDATDVDDEPFGPDAPAQLGRRLAAARSAYLQAA